MKTVIKTIFRLALATLVFSAMPVLVKGVEQESAINQVQWLEGPGIGQLGDVAEIRIPSEYRFANGADTRILLEAMRNLTSGKEVGLMVPNSQKWFMCFEFDNTGYVSDKEKDVLDADAMLKSLRENNEEGNKERAQKGWPPFKIVGWHQAPYYDSVTHNLEWAIIIESEGKTNINWNTRVLGRGGVMSVTLMADPSVIQSIRPEYSQALADFSFKKGQQYQEFREGDKMAEYGLTALVVGGATAAAVKTGAAKWLWKFIVVAFGGIAVFIKNLFSRKNK